MVLGPASWSWVLHCGLETTMVLGPQWSWEGVEILQIDPCLLLGMAEPDVQLR